MIPGSLDVDSTEPDSKTIYLLGLGSDDESAIAADFRAYPFPNWTLEILPIGTATPADVAAGKAILVVGCGRTESVGCVEAMWLLRQITYGCPWVSVSYRPDRLSRQQCEAAGAAACVSRPCDPPTLRELIWRCAVPRLGVATASPKLGTGRLLSYLRVLGADLVLKFASSERTGFLAVRGGQPIAAQMVDGPSGEDALPILLEWRSGTVSGLPLPENLKANLPDPMPDWTDEYLRVDGSPVVVGAVEACDCLVEELPGAIECAVVDLTTGRLAGQPTTSLAGLGIGDDTLMGVLELLRPIADEGSAWASEVVVRSRDGWWAMTWLEPTPFALVVAADVSVPLSLARTAIETAAEEFERCSHPVVRATLDDAATPLPNELERASA